MLFSLSRLIWLIGSNMYNWQYKEWPNFIYRLEEIQSIAVAFTAFFVVVF